jgi:hypothetical protein
MEGDSWRPVLPVVQKVAAEGAGVVEVEEGPLHLRELLLLLALVQVHVQGLVAVVEAEEEAEEARAGKAPSARGLDKTALWQSFKTWNSQGYFALSRWVRESYLSWLAQRERRNFVQGKRRAQTVQKQELKK